MKKLTLLIIYFLTFYIAIAIVNSIFGNGDINLMNIIQNTIHDATEIGKLYNGEKIGITEGQKLFGSKFYFFFIIAIIFIATSTSQFFLWLIGSEGSLKKELKAVKIITSIITIISVFIFFLLILNVGLFPSPYGTLIDFVFTLVLSAIATLLTTFIIFLIE